MFGRRRKPAPTALQIFLEFSSLENVECEFFPGLSDYDISTIERQIGKPIPEELCEILRYSNGSDYLSRSFSLFGLHKGSPPFQIGDIVKATERHIEQRTIGPNALVFGQRMDGGLFVLHPLHSDENLYSVWYAGDDEPSHESTSFSRWAQLEVEFWKRCGL